MPRPKHRKEVIPLKKRKVFKIVKNPGCYKKSKNGTFGDKIHILPKNWERGAVLFPLGKIERRIAILKYLLCQTVFYSKTIQQWFQSKLIWYTYVYINMCQQKMGTIIVCWSIIVFQFDWHFVNRISSGTVLHRITFPLLGFSFKFWMFWTSGPSLFQSQRASAVLMLNYFS